MLRWVLPALCGEQPESGLARSWMGAYLDSRDAGYPNGWNMGDEIKWGVKDEPRFSLYIGLSLSFPFDYLTLLSIPGSISIEVFGDLANCICTHPQCLWIWVSSAIAGQESKRWLSNPLYDCFWKILLQKSYSDCWLACLPPSLVHLFIGSL